MTAHLGKLTEKSISCQNGEMDTGHAETATAGGAWPASVSPRPGALLVGKETRQQGVECGREGQVGRGRGHVDR